MATEVQGSDKSALPEKAGVCAPTALLETKSMRQYQIQDYETDGATCPECGQQFSGRAGLSKHHSAKHGGIFKPLAACDFCGALYYENPDNLHTSENHYCTESCRKAAFSRDRSGDSNPLYQERATNTCRECGGEFQVRPSESERPFCSRECYDDWQRGREWEKEDGRVQSVCGLCEESFSHWPSRDAKFCSNECANNWKASRTGPNHPLWKGGVNWYRAIRSALGPTGWHTQRKEHLGDECEMCGESADSLALHHIIPVLAGGTNAEYNYMTLCPSCHNTVEARTREFADPVLLGGRHD